MVRLRAWLHGGLGVGQTRLARLMFSFIQQVQAPRAVGYGDGELTSMRALWGQKSQSWEPALGKVREGDLLPSYF